MQANHQLGTFAGSTFASAATVAPGMSLPTLSTDAVVEKTQWRGRLPRLASRVRPSLGLGRHALPPLLGSPRLPVIALISLNAAAGLARDRPLCFLNARIVRDFTAA